MSRGGWRRRTIRPAPTPSDTPARAAPGRPLHPHRHTARQRNIARLQEDEGAEVRAVNAQWAAVCIFNRSPVPPA